jgi:hypothetical protein
MSSDLPSMNTVGAICRKAVPPVEAHRVEYVIASRGIQPIGRAGNCRVFSDGDVEFILAVLQRIAREKEPAR